MDDDALHVGRSYWLKLGTQMVSATVQQPKYTVNVNTMEHLAAKDAGTERDWRGRTIATDKPIVFEPYADSRALGRVHPDRQDHQPHGGRGMLHFSLRRAQNVHWQATGHHPRRARR
jgi:bifunctional enzyme CysN/CysC